MMDGKEIRMKDQKNYKSFYTEDGSHAKIEVDRILEKDFIQHFDSWDDVLKVWPHAKASKVALILKTKEDGTIKRRFVIDLLRSGTNGEMDIPERVVLPRLGDFVAGIVDLLTFNTEEQNAEFDASITLMALDFTDAFYTLWLQKQARGGFAFRTLDGWAVFRRLCFGMAGAPLIWGRVAAAACRLSQAAFQPWELRLQCYVDDPAVAVRGSKALRRHLLACLLLFWSVLGLQLSYSKGSVGQDIPWIGTRVKVTKQTHPCGLEWAGVLVTLQEQKMKELRDNVEELFRARGLVNIKPVRIVAGQLSWASGIFCWIKSFNACLWRALTAHVEELEGVVPKASRARKRPTDLMFTVRIEQAIR
jgi:hypothetical protein